MHELANKNFLLDSYFFTVSYDNILWASRMDCNYFYTKVKLCDYILIYCNKIMTF